MLLASDRQREHHVEVFSMDSWVLLSLSIFSVNTVSERAILALENWLFETDFDQN
jgi:hypothetical protein